MSDPLPRVRRLDADWAVAAVRESVGVELAVEGPCPGGQVGAAYVRAPDGHRSVLSWQPGQTLAQMRSRQLATMAVLRDAGYPSPAVEVAAEVVGPGGEVAVVLVQELLPGRPVSRVDAAVLVRLLELVDLQAGALAARTDVPLLRLHLRDDGPGYCLHEPLRRHSRRTAALERWVQGVSAELGADELPGTDAVHGDLQPSNLLATDGRLTGVVDWDGAGRGDRHLDLVTLRFGLWPDAADPDVARHLDGLLDTVPADVLRPAWAHMSLRMVDWAIRHFPPGSAETWLDLAERRVG